MGFIQFIRNLNYLFKLNLKTMNRELRVCKETVARDHDRMEYTLPPMLSYLDQLYKRESSETYNKPIIKNLQDTLHELVNSDKSLIRFGDGELRIADGRSEVFQEGNSQLQTRLLELLGTDEPNIMIGLTSWLWYKPLPILQKWDLRLEEYHAARATADKHLIKGKTYYDAEISLIYGLTGSNTGDWYDQWRSIWAQKDVAIICGDRVFSKIEHNIFDNAASIEYLLIPTCNAFAQYDDIMQQALKIANHKIICIIAGATATVLAYDLTVQGHYRCLDIGHLVKDYDCWKRGLSADHEIMQTYWLAD